MSRILLLRGISLCARGTSFAKPDPRYRRRCSRDRRLSTIFGGSAHFSPGSSPRRSRATTRIIFYLGSRFQARTPETVAACAKYCGIVSFNVYREDLTGEDWARFHALGKPGLIGEFQFGSTDTGLFWPGPFDVAVEEQHGPAYAAYLGSVLANSGIVGFHWFQYVDEPLTGRLLDGEKGHMGFVSVADVPCAGRVSAVRETNLSLLKSLQCPIEPINHGSCERNAAAEVSAA